MYKEKPIDRMDTVRYVTCARVSDDKQDLKSQKMEIGAWCSRHLNKRYVSHGDFSETISTLKNWRKRKDGLMKIVGLAKARKIDHVIFYSIFRLGRTPSENHEIAEYLKECGVSMWFISENCYYGAGMTDGDTLIFSMMSSLAKMERDRKSRRAKRGHKKFLKNNPDKIWGQQPKLRGKTLEMFIELYNARKPISRPWDARRQKDGDGMTDAYSLREIADILKVNKSTISRYVARLCSEGKIEPRSKKIKQTLSDIKHISKEAAEHAAIADVHSKRPKYIEIYDEATDTTTMKPRETPMYLPSGELHPAYADETLGPFGQVTKEIEAKLDTMEFVTPMSFIRN